MLHHNQQSGCLRCQNGIAKNPQIPWRHKGTGAPPPTRRRVQTQEPTPPPPSSPPAPTGKTSRAQPSEIINLLAGYTYLHAALACADFFEDDEGTEHNSDFDPDMLNGDG